MRSFQQIRFKHLQEIKKNSIFPKTAIKSTQREKLEKIPKFGSSIDCNEKIKITLIINRNVHNNFRNK